MRINGLNVAILLGLLSPTAAVAQPEPHASTKSATAVEIERILAADNVDVSTLSSRGVADAIARVGRGRAPADFWRAYQAHVRAWEQLAETEERGGSVADGAEAMADYASELGRAILQVEATFQDVTRIARDYGARLPVAAAELKLIV